MVQVNNDTALNLDNGDQIILLGVTATAISAGDVLLGPQVP